MELERVAIVVELGLLCGHGPCDMRGLLKMFCADDNIGQQQIKDALALLEDRWRSRAMELVETASGWQLRTRAEYRESIGRMLESAPAKLSRPLLEVLAIVAYRQPVTRGDIETVRGVSTSAGQLSTLEGLGWVEVTSRRETPGRPLLYGTTRQMLDDLGLCNLSELPDLNDFELPAKQAESKPENAAAGARDSEEAQEPGDADESGPVAPHGSGS